MLKPFHILFGAGYAFAVSNSAAAGEPVATEVLNRDGYVRFIIAGPDGADFNVELSGSALRIDFDRVLTGDFSAPVAEAPAYFLAARHEDETSALEFLVRDNARLHISQSQNVIAVDILAPGFTGALTNIVSYRELLHDRTARFFAGRTPSVKSAPAAVHLAVLQLAAAEAPISGKITAAIIPAEEFQFSPVVAFETHRARTRSEGFAAVEEALLSDLAAAGENKPIPVRDLVTFYMAHSLHAEALAVIGGQNTAAQNIELVLLAAISNYKLGRWSEAISLLDSGPLRGLDVAAAWRGMAYIKSGVYQAGAKDLLKAGASYIPHEENAADYFLAKAVAAMNAGAFRASRSALQDMRGRAINDAQRAERRLIEARLLAREGRPERAHAILENLAAAGPAPYGNIAALELLKAEFHSGRLGADSALIKTDALLMTWRGGAFEREALAFYATVLDSIPDIAEGFRTRRRLANNHPASDLGGEARKALTARLSALFEETDLSPMAAAEIFYENIDLAPPGREGDALISGVAAQLAALDLIGQAGELLDHQVFNRLRGAARSQSAARLAALYLEDGRPDEALRVLRSTRLTRLPAALNLRRRLLEARTLYASGDRAGAVALLEDDDSQQAAALRGDIYWKSNDWAKAGAAYMASLDIAQKDNSLSRTETARALRAASAFALAGEQATLAEFTGRIKSRIEDSAAKAIFVDIGGGGLIQEPAKFMAAYEEYFLGDAAADS